MARQVLCLVLTIVFLGNASSEVLNDTKECKEGVGNFVLLSCANSIVKGAPEQAPADFCCNAIKYAEVKCICTAVTKDIENTIDMNRFVKVANICGKPLVPGSDCGSYKVPSA